MKNLQFSVAFIFIGLVAFAQNTRISDSNSIGWFAFSGNFNISPKFGIHTEYQWRRENMINNWQQGLLRVGVNYQLNPTIQLRLGYAWVETFAYGDYPLNSMGKDFTEHRVFQMATLNNKISIVDFSHRFMLEQRWIGRYSNADLSTEDDYVFINRMRYMFRMQLPLKGKSIENKTPYIALYDEIFIGFGENVNENIFDQNRLGLLIGYKFSNTVRVEGGYLNQQVQLGREIGGRNVFQNNNGIIVNTILNFNMRKKDKI